MLTGIRAGKTIAGINESLFMATEGWINFKAPNQGCIVAPTYVLLRDVVEREC